MAPTQKNFAAGSKFPPNSSGKMRIYSMRFCPYAHRTRLVLEHKNIPFETININLRNKPDWFLERNPLGLVPVLELDDKTIYESTATCDWLDDVYPQNKLQSTDPYRKAWDRILIENFGKIATSFDSMLSPEKRDGAIEILQKSYSFFEDALKKRVGPLFGGDNPCMVDFLIWPWMERIAFIDEIDPRAVIDKEKFPLFGCTWYNAMTALPAVKATMFDKATHLQFFKSLISDNPEYDLGLDE